MMHGSHCLPRPTGHRFHPSKLTPKASKFKNFAGLALKATAITHRNRYIATASSGRGSAAASPAEVHSAESAAHNARLAYYKLFHFQVNYVFSALALNFRLPKKTYSTLTYILRCKKSIFYGVR